MKSSKKSPISRQLIIPVYKAVLALGGSATNDEICEKVIEMMNLTSEQIDEPHLRSITQTELQYQLAWTRTYMKNYGILERSGRGVWAVTADYLEEKTIDPSRVCLLGAKKKNVAKTNDNPPKPTPIDDEEEKAVNEEVIEEEAWKERLSQLLMEINPYAFERLAQRLLRECGFEQVTVTKKSGDGGIDGTGRLKINGIFSFNVAFQCKRYSGTVGAPEIRDFRGSLSTNIEKGIFITTGRFTQQAKEEASAPGKRQIDLMDGEDFMEKLAQYGIGVKEVKIYQVDEAFFEKFESATEK
ncbi:MAG: restriction endonuclease [Erysipelotrichaceae bacterium]|nr:restriction endonuclease [Erysipelotrichaceae bacterium]